MQVATLFRESATLLGASMEAGGVNTASQEVPSSVLSPVLGLGLDSFSHPNNKFKLNMKLEPQDDGYETSADLLLSNSTNPNNTLKCDSMEDPYSFIDDDPMSMMPSEQGHLQCLPSVTVPHTTLSTPKKRGRKKKIKNEPGLDFNLGLNCSPQPKVKERKKHDRFNGMPEEEVSKRTLPDHLITNLDIIIIGINPGLFAAYKGHHYAGPGNHFWKCLYLSGLTPEQMTADEDYKLLQVGIGFTNMVQRPTKGSADLTRKEIKEGCQILLEKLQRFKPKIAVFNGKLIYEVFSGKKDFSFGRQPDRVDGTNTYMWVMPSSSARCAQLPRAADKVPFYAALKKFRDYLNGIVTNIDDSEVVFTDSRLKNCCDSESKPGTVYSMELMDISNAVIKKEEIIPCKKKRGRPKKIKVEGEETKPVVCKTQNQSAPNCDFPKKKRGRPKKIKCEESEVSMQERNTHTPISKCFSSPSPIQSPTNFYHINPQMTSPNSGSNNMYNNSMSMTHQSYSQSPRPHSQPFTHSDLSSEISAAISSDQLGSPAPTSPSLGPPDFDPPTSMPTDDTIECRFSSPAPSTASEQPSAGPLTLPLGASTPYPSYHTFGIEPDSHGFPQTPAGGGAQLQARAASVSDYKVEDMSSKSLSGLESLVDQIPNIAEGETISHSVEAISPEHGEQYAGGSIYPHYSGTPRLGGSPSAGGGGGSPTAQPYSNYPGSNNGYGSLTVASLSNSSSGSFVVGNLANSYGHGHSSPGAYGNLMNGSHAFMEHHGCGVAVPQLPVALPYGQLPYGQQFSNAYPAPPTLHVPSPNYPAPYYNAGYAHPQSGGAHSPGPAYLHNHIFDRIKPDIGYGSF